MALEDIEKDGGYWFIDSDHMIDEPGEFRAIMSHFGLPMAVHCWMNAHPIVQGAAMFIACIAFGVLCEIVAAVAVVSAVKSFRG